MIIGAAGTPEPNKKQLTQKYRKKNKLHSIKNQKSANKKNSMHVKR